MGQARALIQHNPEAEESNAWNWPPTNSKTLENGDSLSRDSGADLTLAADSSESAEGGPTFSGSLQQLFANHESAYNNDSDNASLTRGDSSDDKSNLSNYVSPRNDSSSLDSGTELLQTVKHSLSGNDSRNHSELTSLFSGRSGLTTPAVNLGDDLVAMSSESDEKSTGKSDLGRDGLTSIQAKRLGNVNDDWNKGMAFF